MPLTFHYKQLPNGLDIVAEENPDAHSFAVGLFVKTGSRDEHPSVNGVSHFLEHMMFKGSTKYTWEDVNRIFDEIGAKYNAFTSQEMTAYYANVLPEFTERAIEHLSHLLRPAIRVEDFTTEKKVILEEIAMYLDDPGHRVYERLMEAHFGNHPLSMSILGSAESIQKLQRDEMADYFRSAMGRATWFFPRPGKSNSMRLCVWPRSIADVAACRCARTSARPDLQVPAAGYDRRQAQSPISHGHDARPQRQDDRRFAARVLSDVIGDSDGSRFYWALVDNAIAEEADLASIRTMPAAVSISP